MKWLEIDQDNLYVKFSVLNVDFSSPSPEPLGLRWPAQAGIRYGCFPKSGYFSAIGSCSMKMVEDKQLIITSNSDKFFIGVNINDL